MTRTFWLAIAGLSALTLGSAAAACSSPAEPTLPDDGDASRGTFMMNGRLVGTVTGEPIAGATVTLGARTIVTDADGRFTVRGVASGARDVSINGEGLVPRQTQVLAGSRDLTLDVIQDRSPFDLLFFREIGRNALETTGGLEPLRPLREAPRVYIRTVDTAGVPISNDIVDLVESEIRAAAPVWSAGRYPVTTVERGADTRENQPGWITVVFPGELEGNLCGRATLGTTTGYIQLHYLNVGCRCGGATVARRTVRHELGHVYGFWHTGTRGGVMSKDWTRRQCNGEPTGLETQHAGVMYSRSDGNLDPDIDPESTLLSKPPPIVIEN